MKLCVKGSRGPMKVDLGRRHEGESPSHIPHVTLCVWCLGSLSFEAGVQCFGGKGWVTGLGLTAPSLGSTCVSGEMVCTSELCPGTPSMWWLVLRDYGRPRTLLR